MEDILYNVLDFRLIKGEYIWKIYYTLTSLLKEVALNMSFEIRKDLDILCTNGPNKRKKKMPQQNIVVGRVSNNTTT